MMTTPNKALHDALLHSGWTKILPPEAKALSIGDNKFLTWGRSGIRIATSASSREYEQDSAKVRIFSADNGDEVTMEVIKVDARSRGKGLAKQALKEWTELAKRLGVTLYVEPAEIEVSTNRKRLVGLYSDSGFKPTDPFANVMKFDGKGDQETR